MNPSAHGWIEKLCYQILKKTVPYSDFDSLYEDLKSYGFIYGVNLSITDAVEKIHNYSEDELVKINLLTGLFHIYKIHRPKASNTNFINVLLSYYKELEVSDLSLWDKLVIGNSDSIRLERLIHDRVRIDDNSLTRNFNKSIINALLFVDVLTFDAYLDNAIDVKTYAANLESISVGTLYQSLNSRSKITESDKEIIEIFETSTSYFDEEDLEVDDMIYDIDYNINHNEKIFLIDLMSLSIWDDQILEKSEFRFLKSLARRLDLDAEIIHKAIMDIDEFHKRHEKEILFFQQSNPINNFYENSLQLVKKLIQRNSKRLVKELRQSKDLLFLITKSTHTELSKEEQKKLQEQLVDLLKTIPSLAIFMLPGGAILLPIFAKLIPNMLPSAFDDNRINPKE